MIGPFGVIVDTYLSAPVQLKSVVHRCTLACSQVNTDVNYFVFLCHSLFFLICACIFVFLCFTLAATQNALWDQQ